MRCSDRSASAITLLMAFGLHGQATQTHALCSVDGVVKNVANGSPVPRAKVAILPLPTAEQAIAEAQARHVMGKIQTVPGPQVVTDSDGKFCFDAPASAQFLLSVSRRGFADSHYGASTPFESGAILTPSAGKGLTPLLFPYATISGRVLDPDNDPADGGAVQVYSKVWMRGAFHYFPVKQVLLDDLGEFRVGNLLPGTYYLAYLPAPNTGRAERTGPGGPVPMPVRTFYPSAMRLSDATGIAVKAGEQVPGIDVRVRTATTHRIRGTVTGSFDRSGFGAVAIAPDDEDPVSIMLGTGNLSPDGNFLFSDLVSGTYRITYVSGSSVMRAPFSLGDHDLDDARLDVPSPVSLKGRIQVENAASIDLPSVHLELNSTEAFVAPTYVASVAPNGEFAFNGVSPGKYALTISPPKGTYVKAVTYAQTDILHAPFYAARDTGEVNVILRQGVAQLDGRLDGTSLHGGSAYWLLTPAVLNADGTGAHFGTTREDGSFSVVDLAPGRYRAFAFRTIDIATILRPDVLKKLEAAGIIIDLGENDRAAIILRVVRDAVVQQAIDESQQ